MNKTVTLTGTILEAHIRTTQPKTRTEMRYNALAQRRVPTEVTPKERQYAVLKLRSERTSVVHRCIAWDVDDLSKRPIAWANPGDKVEITGTPKAVTLKREDESTFDLHQIVVSGYTVLRKQPRTRVA